MIIKIGTVAETTNIFSNIPKEVAYEALNICTNLDKYYGADRDIDYDDGGYVIVLTDITDTNSLTDNYNIDLSEDVFEYAEEILCDPPYINILYLKNNDFAVTLLIPKSLVPDNILEEFN